MKGTLEERFFAKARKGRKPDDCWEWLAVTNSQGYGRIRVDDQMKLSHRISWWVHFGPIPKGLQVHHHCDNPPCSNPSHLWIGTQSDNIRDCSEKGRLITVGKSRMTCCPNGHEYTVENTAFETNGHRRCRECNRRTIRVYMRKWREKQRRLAYV